MPKHDSAGKSMKNALDIRQVGEIGQSDFTSPSASVECY